jgi:hypothetical protein
MRDVRTLTGTWLTAGVLAAATAVIAPIGVPSVTAAGPVVVLNELHYHAVDDNPLAEYVELLNTTAAPIDLSNWTIGGIGYTFPAGSVIGANAFLVVPATAYSGGLSNGGERIRLRNPANTTIDEVEYDDVGLWPALADGEGQSLQRRDPAASGKEPGNWLSAALSPGAPNSVAGVGLLPSFSAVTNTVLPAAGAPIQVTATLKNGAAPRLFYRVGFGPEAEVPVTLSGTSLSASIPGQAAGELVRYRLVATSSSNGSTGTWPRQGDGASYVGTTVVGGTPSGLVRFQWFMEPPVYTAMIKWRITEPSVLGFVS